MSDQALSVRYVRVLIDAVERRGVSPHSFLQLAQWDPQPLDAVEGRVPCSEFARLCELALDLTREPALGLHALRAIRSDSVDLVAHLVAHAATLREALDQLLRMHKLFGNERRFHVDEVGDEVTLRYESPRGMGEGAQRYLAEMTMAGAHAMLRYFAPHARATKVCFEHAAPAYRAEYDRVFDDATCFEQPFTAIVFERALLDAARRYHDPEFARALRAMADDRILRLERGMTCADRVREVLATHETPGRATMVSVAQALGMSPRSLRRHLAAEATTYEAVFDDALASKARRLLSVEQRSIDETAQALGYSATSAFHRAFKRWTGTTPRAWRLGNK